VVRALQRRGLGPPLASFVLRIGNGSPGILPKAIARHVLLPAQLLVNGGGVPLLAYGLPNTLRGAV
jgi:hypothetical protein